MSNYEKNTFGNSLTANIRDERIVKPYYLEADGVTGFDEQTLGQIDKKTVVSNNVLIII